ncbi:MAG: PKD domain-containing protein [Bacteroidia bacterium]|nr:PKD domain-containing protein [Bacteroidia bacterium]
MKKNYQLVTLFIIGCLSIINVSAQHCATDEYHSYRLRQYPNLIQSIQDNEAYYRNYISQLTNHKTQDENIKVIPMVVHVVHDGIPKDPSVDDSISAEQVISQIEVLNQDMRKQQGTRGFGAGVDYRIEFALASKDPNGSPTNGITYTASSLADHQIYDQNLKNLIKWDQTKYFNVWLVKSIIGGASGGLVLGYATFPTSGYPTDDGVVIRSDCWGTIGIAGGPGGDNKYGRTATHEIGHWLNLMHTFTQPDGCGTTNCNTSGDNVCDTPPSYTQNFGSNNRQNTCIIDNPDLPDNTQNYMDYVNDLYTNMFTQGQYNRTISALNNPNIYQRKMWDESNLQATGTGKYGKSKADFWASNKTLCVGGTTKFIEYSRGQCSYFEWSFPGGTPTTSNSANPTVVYNTPGKYSVSLKVGNLNDTSAVYTRTDFITVTDAKQTLPFHEGFEDYANFPKDGWFIENQDEANQATSRTWESWQYESGFAQSSACVRMPFYFYASYNHNDFLTSPTFDLTNTPNPKLSFSWAYSPLIYDNYSSSPKSETLIYSDTLTIEVSTDCGASWSPVWKKGGYQLATVPQDQITYNTLFNQLTANKWDSTFINLTPYGNQASMQVRFKTTNGFGNNLYLDDIKLVNDTTLFRDDLIAQARLKLTPNPIQEKTLLYLDLPTQSAVEIVVTDVLGREVWKESTTTWGAGIHNRSIGFPEAAGLYNVRVLVNGHNYNLKAIKTN